MGCVNTHNGSPPRTHNSSYQQKENQYTIKTISRNSNRDNVDSNNCRNVLKQQDLNGKEVQQFQKQAHKQIDIKGHLKNIPQKINQNNRQFQKKLDYRTIKTADSFSPVSIQKNAKKHNQIQYFLRQKKRLNQIYKKHDKSLKGQGNLQKYQIRKIPKQVHLRIQKEHQQTTNQGQSIQKQHQTALINKQNLDWIKHYREPRGSSANLFKTFKDNCIEDQQKQQKQKKFENNGIKSMENISPFVTK